MNTKKGTKRALISSLLALILCFSMLVGTTYAWFTDTVTTGVNTIQSGTLDVDMVDEHGRSLEGRTLSFRDVNGNDDILWEPGASFALDSFKIVNKGNLALKYKVVISGLAEGDAELLKVIKFTVGEKSLSDYFATTTIEGEVEPGIELKPGESSELITIVGTMDTTAGNEYQNKKIEGVSITVYATQATVENDMDDDQYDAGAEYLELPIAKVVNDGPQTVTETLFSGNWNGLQLLSAPIDLDASFTFTAPADDTTTLDDNAFDDWYADFEVSIDRDLAVDELVLAGQYTAFGEGWIAFANPMEVKADTPVRLLTSVGAPWTYGDIRDVVEVFKCGVTEGANADLSGATLTVQLKVYETNDAGEEVAEYVLGTYTYTFGGVETVEELTSALANGGDVVLSENVIGTLDAVNLATINKDTTLDLNGYSVLLEIPEDEAIGNQALFTVKGGNTLTVKNGNFEITYGANANRLTAIISNEGGNVVIEDGNFKITKSGENGALIAAIIDNNTTAGASNVTINGGTFYSDSAIIRNFVNGSDAKVTINGGDFQYGYFWNQKPSSTAVGQGYFTINGGTFDTTGVALYSAAWPTNCTIADGISLTVDTSF